MYLYLCFIFAFVIRLVNLNQSLWLDESIVAKVVKTIPFHLIPTQLSPGDVHPPLYYMAVSAWTAVFGYSEIALRMPSILFSLVAGWFVYKIGKSLKDHKTGLWAAAFFLFNPLIIYYSQEARMHMMAAMFLTITLYYFVKIVIQKGNSIDSRLRGNDTKSGRNILLFNVFVAFSMITFYGSGFFIAAMILVGAISSKRKLLTFVYLSIGLLISLFLLSPLLYFQALNAKAGLADLKNWSMALGKAELKNVAMIFLKFATGRLSWYPKISYYLIAGIPTAIIWLFALRGALKNRLFALLFVIPLLIGLFISFWAPMMMYFRFLYLVPVMSILIALQIGEPMGKQILKEIRIPIQNQIYRRIRTYIGFIILFFYCAFSFVYLFFSVFHREDWKGLGQHLNINTPVYMILPSSDPVLYYRSDVQIFELRDIKKAEVPETIDVVPYTNEIYGLNHTQLLQEKGCIKESEQHFRGDLILERWKCLRNA